jgi:glycosyltransferase involved in cell wall biosynthesis
VELLPAEAVVVVRIVTLLLHDERFSGWSLEEKLGRPHFARQYLRYCKGLGWEPYLYTFHHALQEMQVFEFEDLGVIKVFPVDFRFPPFLRFGNDHNPDAVLRELARDAPDLVHFHQYYLFSFPYVAEYIRRRMKCPLTVQLHGYHQGWMRRLCYMPCLLALRRVDRVFYSYRPEEAVYRSLHLQDKAVLIPMPSIDPQVFKAGAKGAADGMRLLYVGRVPLSTRTYGEKAPHRLLLLLRRLLRWRVVRLTVVGDGVGLPYCKHLAAELGVLGHVDFTGYRPHATLPEVYRDSVLTLIPMELADVDGFFDGAIQESLACGTPVAAFKSSPKMALEGSRGFLLSKRVEEAAVEVAGLLDEPELLQNMAGKGMRFVHRYCTEERLRETLRTEWEGLLKR